jgi:SAM-dependent methyltransferase
METGPPRIFDRAAYRARRRRARILAGDDFLAREAAGLIAERLAAINRRFEHGLDLHSRPNGFALLKPLALSWIRTGFAWDTPSVVADEEALPFAEASFDVVTSVLSLHAVNDLPGTLVQIRRVLKPDGVFLGVLFGGASLQELKTGFAAAEARIRGGASPRVAPFGDVRELGGLLGRAGLALTVADVERLSVRYRDLNLLFRDLRAHGETNVLAARSSGFLSRRILAALAAEYGARFGDSEGRLPATFDLVFLTGWAPHENQPKPLAPGSARTRLAAALDTTEYPTGEKPTR